MLIDGYALNAQIDFNQADRQRFIQTGEAVLPTQIGIAPKHNVILTMKKAKCFDPGFQYRDHTQPVNWDKYFREAGVKRQRAA